MSRRSIQQWFDAYGESHQHPTNKLIHWICVPTIFFCVVGLLWSIPSPFTHAWLANGWVAKVAVVLVGLFYLRLSLPIMVGMMAFNIACLALAAWLDVHASWPLWAISLASSCSRGSGSSMATRWKGRNRAFWTTCSS